MRFAKAHGTGNDFVVLPDPDGRLDLTPELVAAVCDRRRGVGGDGVLRVVRTACALEALPEAEPQAELRAGAGAAEWFMDYRNADGSIAEMCGNGVRAYVRYLLHAGLIPAGTAALRVATRAGVLPVAVSGELITVTLARPVPGGSVVATLAGAGHPGTRATAGNPHLVCPVGDTTALAALDLTRAPVVDRDAFPAGVNVEFIAEGAPVPGTDRHLHMRVYERGVGETLSCGSGACAAATVALAGAGQATGTVAVDLPGGRLTVTLTPDACLLAGPAVVVASGEICGLAAPRSL